MGKLHKERESNITGISEKDLLWLERIVGITNQVLGDLDHMENDGVKVFLDLLQKNSLFGTSLNKEISKLYDLLRSYRKAKDTEEQDSIREKINDHSAQLQQLLWAGIAVLNRLGEVVSHFLKEEGLLQAAAEAFCQTQLGSTERRKIAGVQYQIKQVLQHTKNVLNDILSEFQAIYQDIEQTLWPAIRYSMESRQKISLEEMISHLGRLHMRILALADSVEREKHLLDEEKKYNRQLRKIILELVSMTKNQATLRNVRQRIGSVA